MEKAVLVCVPHLAYLAGTAAARWKGSFKGSSPVKLHFFASVCHLSSTCAWENLSLKLQDVTAKPVLLHWQKTCTCFLYFGDEVDWKLGRTLFDIGAFKIYP